MIELTNFLARNLKPSLLWLHGPPGIGKTALARTVAQAAGGARWLDFALAASSGPVAWIGEQLASAPAAPDPLVVLDGLGALTPRDGRLLWALFERFPGCYVVATHAAPPPVLQTEDWWGRVTAIRVDALSLPDSLPLLESLGLAPSRAREVARFAGGNPLVLRVLAGAWRGRPGPFDPASIPEVIRALEERFLADLDPAPHPLALAACALARRLDQDDLEHLLGVDDARAAFRWLAELSFVQVTARGLVMDAAAAAVLLEALRWRSPEPLRELSRRAVGSLTGQPARAPLDAVLDALHLVRLALPLDLPPATCELRAEPAPPSEHARLLEVARRQGDAAGALAERWLSDPAARPYLICQDGVPVAAALSLRLSPDAPESFAGDPATERALGVIRRRASLRAGETVLYHRFWGGTAGSGAAAAVCLAHFLALGIADAGAGMDFLVLDGGEGAAGLNALFPLDPEAAFRVGGRTFAVARRDRRAPEVILRAIAGATAELPLTRDACREAVAHALRHLHSLDELAGNALAASHIVGERLCPRASRTDRAEAVACLILDGLRRLEEDPARAHHVPVLERTYVFPLTKQQEAAFDLQLPFSTYRRHLAAAADALAEVIYLLETGALADEARAPGRPTPLPGAGAAQVSPVEAAPERGLFLSTVGRLLLIVTGPAPISDLDWRWFSHEVVRLAHESGGLGVVSYSPTPLPSLRQQADTVSFRGHPAVCQVRHVLLLSDNPGARIAMSVFSFLLRQYARVEMTSCRTYAPALATIAARVGADARSVDARLLEMVALAGHPAPGTA